MSLRGHCKTQEVVAKFCCRSELCNAPLLRLFFYLFPVFLSAEALQFALGAGCRRDDVSFKIPGTYDGKDLLWGVELDTSLKVMPGRFDLTFEGVGGWYVSGSGVSRATVQALGSSTSGRYWRSSGGFFCEGTGAFGYSLGTYPFRWIPAAIFGVFYQQIKYGSSHPQSDANLSYNLSQTRLDRFWYGPGVGVDAQFRPHISWIFSAGYFYYFLHFNQTLDPFADLKVGASELFVQQKFRTSAPAQGQKISGKITAQIAEEWRMNLLFQAFLFSSLKKSTSLKQNGEQVLPTQGSFSSSESLFGDAKWQAYAGLLELEYFF